MGTLSAAWRTCLRCGRGWLGAVVGRHADRCNGRCASNGGFLNRRARRLGPFSMASVASTTGFRTLQLNCGLWPIMCLVRR